MKLVEGLNWRYATKKFDASKKISNENLEIIKEAVRLSASSYGLQAYKVLVIENPEIRKQLRAAAWDQTQITDSSHLFVFCNYEKVDETIVDDYMQLTASTRGIEVDQLGGFKQMILGATGGLNADQMNAWTSKQTYIALSTLLAATSELEIDACPMEGFDANQFNEILGLKEKGLSVSVIAAVGYRAVDDSMQFAPKVRKPAELLFEAI